MQQTLQIVSSFSILVESLSSIRGYDCLLVGNGNEPMNGIHLQMSGLGAVDCVVQALL